MYATDVLTIDRRGGPAVPIAVTATPVTSMPAVVGARVGASLGALAFQVGHMGARLGWHGAVIDFSPSTLRGVLPVNAIAPLDIDRLGTVLSVWAHPDDETYLAGGVMASCVAAGQRVVCVSATAGEHGTADPVAWPPERLGASASMGDGGGDGRARRRRTPLPRVRGRHRWRPSTPRSGSPRSPT